MHLIQHHILEINCTSPDFGKEVQSVVGSVMENDFYPKLEVLLDRYSDDRFCWKIDAIELTLPNLTDKNWKTEFVNNSLIQIETYLKQNKIEFELSQKTTDLPSPFVTVNLQAEMLFFSYLKTGILSINSSFTSLFEVVSKIELNEEFISKCKMLFEENPATLIRFILNISEEFKTKLARQLVDFSTHSDTELVKVFSKTELFSVIKLSLWMEFLLWTSYFIPIENKAKQSAWLQQFLENAQQFWNLNPEKIAVMNQFVVHQMQLEESFISNPFLVRFFKLLDDYLKETNSAESTLSVQISEMNSNEKEVLFESEKEAKNEIVDRSLYLKNAGLVLFHPFLKSLFEQLNWCENEKWLSKTNQHKAILLLHYLITGNQNYFENELILNKILCGFSITEVVNTKLKLSKKELEKANSLLLAVLEYWKILGETSVEALRETFLQREGKIELSNDGSSELWVEQKGVDVLLSDLPWGIGLIKTPWMKNYMNCYWN